MKKRRETKDRKYSFDADVADWLDRQPGNVSILISNLVREAGMGPAHKKKQLESIIAADGPGSLEALAELEELEKHKETTSYKLRFKQMQERIIREYTINGGFVRSTIRDHIQDNLDMDKIEVIEFVNHTVEDFEKGYIARLELKQEIKELKAQRPEEPEILSTPVDVIKHGADEIRDYCPY